MNRRALAPAPATIGLAVTLGCASRDPVPLRTLEPPELAWGSMDIQAAALLVQSGTGTLDLNIDLHIEHQGKQPARMDLASATVQVDGLPWERCRTPFDFNSDQLLIVLAPQETTSLSFTCLEVPRPSRSLTLRFAGSGLGTSTPTIDIPFSGMRNR